MGYYSGHHHHRKLSLRVNYSYLLNLFIQSFIFFGFMVAGEEIESKYTCFFLRADDEHAFRSLDPFGYDKNDLNLDHFTDNIIREFNLSFESSRH